MIVFGWYMNVDVLILDKHRHAFCHLENSGRFIYCKTQSEHVFSDRCVWVGNALRTSFLLIHVVSL